MTMNKIPNHTSLKEWASVIDALGSGDQIVLIRKGGLADQTFGVEAGRFYLFPTNYHDAGGAEPSHVRITHWAEVLKTWQIRDSELLPRLEPLTVLDRDTINTRYRFRPDQAINVIAVRAYRLATPAEVVMKPEYAGCRSWVSIDEEIGIDGSLPALGEEAMQARIAAIDALLLPVHA
ncbi:MAG TPA: DUF1802 family protein [Thermoanaerobaculia bacterium]